MAVAEKRTFSLSAEHAAFIDAGVSSGAYATAGEVVRDALRGLQDHHSAIERWLHQDVAATYDAMQADPSRALSASAVFDDIRAHHAARIKERS